jgi:hypothetical protein
MPAFQGQFGRRILVVARSHGLAGDIAETNQIRRSAVAGVDAPSVVVASPHARRTAIRGGIAWPSGDRTLGHEVLQFNHPRRGPAAFGTRFFGLCLQVGDHGLALLSGGVGDLLFLPEARD